MVAKKIDKRLSESYKIHLLVSKGWDKSFNLAKMSIRWVHSKTFCRVLAFSKIREKKREFSSLTISRSFKSNFGLAIVRILIATHEVNIHRLSEYDILTDWSKDL